MKKIITAALLFAVCMTASAQAYYLGMQQRNANNTGWSTQMVAPPSGAYNGVMIYNDATNLPEFVKIGIGLTISGGFITLDGVSPAAYSGNYFDLINTPIIPAAQINSDWNATSGLEQILNKPTMFDGAYSSLTGVPSTFTANTHSHVAAEITDSTSVGRSVLTAVSQDAARTAIGATNFDGAFNSLTGTPSLFDGTWSSLTGKPTDLSSFSNGPGYITTSSLSSYATTSALTTGLAGKEAAGAATAAQAFAIQRTNHTGTQSIATITANAYVGNTAQNKAIQIYKSATVASGVAVFHLTADSTSGGSAICSEVFADSVQVTVNDSAASYQYGWVFSNSDKTLTVTVNKFTTANILTGLLGQSAANGAVTKLSVGCVSN